MKCLDCIFFYHSSGGQIDDPYPHFWCRIGHWEDGRPPEEEETTWDDCKDYIMKWKYIREEQPDPKQGTVLYRHRKPGRGRTWFVGLAYFTVLGKWKAESISTPWPPEECRGYPMQWTEIPE